MTDEHKTTEGFFDHLQKAGGPTRLGVWFVRLSSRRILAFAGAAPGSSVLEIGPGRGELAALCLDQKLDYHAVEPNPGLADSLRARGVNIICSLVPPLPDLGRKFDLVLMVNVMEHMNGLEQALEVARQVRRVLNPGGKFLIHSPDYLSWRQQFFNCDFSHNYVTTRRRLDQLLVDAGYEDVRSCYVSGPLRGPVCHIASGIASRLPFGALDALFPRCPVCSRLYKLQLTFSRRVLITGTNKT